MSNNVHPYPHIHTYFDAGARDFLIRPETKDNREFFIELRAMYWELSGIAWEMTENINYNRFLRG